VPEIKIKRNDKYLFVTSAYWQVRHNLRAGGCWDSITFKHGSGKNLLAAPVSGRIRILNPHPTSDAGSPFFYEEKFDRNPQVTVEQSPQGPVVAVEGRYQLDSGPPAGSDVPRELPIRFRRRYQYREWGLVAVTLEIICDQERADVVEVVAADVALREGMTHAYARQHPIPLPSSCWTGAGKWYDLKKEEYFVCKYVPLHLVCFEKGSDGLEFMPASDLSQWDLVPDKEPGLGYYMIGPSWENPQQMLLSVAPYCVCYRRNPIRLQGAGRIQYYLTLPFIKPAEAVGSPYFHAGAHSQWPSDAELERSARCGVKLIRFHNDYRIDGPFWHDGQYPPYDEQGMAELRRIIATCHRLGLKIVPYISCKEFHPDADDFKANQQAWQREQGPNFRELHTWYGTGEFGQLMCLESGWLAFRKQSMEIILRDLPWDGLYFDWCTPHPCRHAQHLNGAIHTDQDAFLDLMYWCRQRVGPQGIILTHLSGLPQIVIENMSTATLIYEDKYSSVHPASPLDFPPQCEFMPIAPRHLCGWGAAGSVELRQCLMTTLLQGTPPIPTLPADQRSQLGSLVGRASDEMLREFELFSGEDFTSYRFIAASRGVVQTNNRGVGAALWHRQDKVLLYLANLSEKSARGKVQLPAGLTFKAAGRAQVNVSVSGKDGAAKMSAAALRNHGISYALKPWSSAAVKVES